MIEVMTHLRSLAAIPLLLVVVLFAARPGSAVAASEKAPVPTVNGAGGTGLKGYDPVGYFTLGQPTPGVDQYTYRWKDVTYRFAFRREPGTVQGRPGEISSAVWRLLRVRYGDKPHCGHRSIPMGDRRWQALFE